MVRVILFFVMLITGNIIAQNSAEDDIKKTVETFFDGFHKGDTTLMKSIMMEKFTMQTAYKNKEGSDVLVTEESSTLINAIANRPKDQKWDERLLDFNIQVDGNMANAWTTYEFWF